MVDTVNLRVRRALAPQIADELRRSRPISSGHWYFEATSRICKRTGRPYRSFAGRHELLGISVRGKDDVIESVQASLPRILHGYNGRLIKTPFELVKALEMLDALADETSTSIDSMTEFTRVDLVLNFPGNPKQFVLAHKNARHPKVRREHLVYAETGIRFPGKEVVIQMYWKQKERADKAGFDLPALSNSTRVEVQLKGQQVREILGHGDTETPVYGLDFFHCYRMYRSVLCGFDQSPPLISSEKCTLLALIAECEAVGFKTSSGLGAMDWYSLSGQKSTTLSRAKAEIQKRQRKVMMFRWADKLPLLTLPEPVMDIHRDGQEVPLTGLW